MPVNLSTPTVFFGLTKNNEIIGNGLVQPGKGSAVVRGKYAKRHNCKAICVVPYNPEIGLKALAQKAADCLLEALKKMGKAPKKGLRICV